ncbi:phosphoglycerate mutase [Caballeronia sordidicola]|uniref:Phosphoglycerate mutase n=1 Tax=Caballeronia sordidicola TaxID=196367 RepID=A0A158F5M1_CABSO|nr:histidine phosphatase family protein [Caballeronia sordidicola]SAL14320.1 phosphoglycerate mutase [Caballeronia sordidicola]
MTTQVLFIRHGETDWNRIKRIQGHIDIPLAASGVAQAGQLAQRLLQESQTGARLDAVYSSDLQRARQTAKPFADALGLSLKLNEGLRERWYGDFQGYDSAEILARFPAEHAVWQSHDPDFTPPGGESQREFSRRVLNAIEPIVAAHPGGRIACVAHGGVLDCIYRFAREIPLEAPRDWLLLNTSINVVDFENGQAKVVSWGDVAHLAAPSSDDDLKEVPR